MAETYALSTVAKWAQKVIRKTHRTVSSQGPGQVQGNSDSFSATVNTFLVSPLLGPSILDTPFSNRPRNKRLNRFLKDQIKKPGTVCLLKVLTLGFATISTVAHIARQRSLAATLALTYSAPLAEKRSRLVPGSKVSEDLKTSAGCLGGPWEVEKLT